MKKIVKYYLFTAAIVASVLIVSCSKEDIAVTHIKLEQTSTNMFINGTLKMRATVYPDNATNKKVKWISSDESVATVNANGEVTAKTQGLTTISATTNDGGFNDSRIITVGEGVTMTTSPHDLFENLNFYVQGPDMVSINMGDGSGEKTFNISPDYGFSFGAINHKGSIYRIKISGLNMFTLLCSNNRLTSLDLSGCTTLRHLDCSYNMLSATALNDLFVSLHDNNAPLNKIIIISGNPGTKNCDLTILERKGWMAID